MLKFGPLSCTTQADRVLVLKTRKHLALGASAVSCTGLLPETFEYQQVAYD